MTNERPRRAKVVFSVSKPIPADAYLKESSKLFKKQTETGDFDRFNVHRVMIEIGQT
jgi:hypothetical protein